MASIDFPSSPTPGQLYTFNGITYYYDSAVGAWLTSVYSNPFPNVYPTANAGFAVANAAFANANATQTFAVAAFVNANATQTLVEAAFSNANATQTFAISGYAVANAAFSNANATQTFAIAAFNKANSYVGLIPSVISTNTNANSGTYYIATGTVTLTLPLSPSVGDTVGFYNYSSNLNSVINRNGSNVMSLADNVTVDTANTSFIMRYTDLNRGWIIT